MAKQTDYSNVPIFGCVINPINKTQRYNVYPHKKYGFVSIDRHNNNKIISTGKTVYKCGSNTRIALKEKFYKEAGALKNKKVMFNSNYLWNKDLEKLKIRENHSIWLHGIIKEVELRDSYSGFFVYLEILIFSDTGKTIVHNGKDIVVTINDKKGLYIYNSRAFKKLQEQQGFINDIQATLSWRHKNNNKTIEKLTKLIEND